MNNALGKGNINFNFGHHLWNLETVSQEAMEAGQGEFRRKSAGKRSRIIFLAWQLKVEYPQPAAGPDPGKGG